MKPTDLQKFNTCSVSCPPPNPLSPLPRHHRRWAQANSLELPWANMRESSECDKRQAHDSHQALPKANISLLSLSVLPLSINNRQLPFLARYTIGRCVGLFLASKRASFVREGPREYNTEKSQLSTGTSEFVAGIFRKFVTNPKIHIVVPPHQEFRVRSSSNAWRHRVAHSQTCSTNACTTLTDTCFMPL